MPWAGGLKAVVEGPIAVSGQADVSVTVKVEAGSSLISAAESAKSAGKMAIQNTGKSGSEASPGAQMGHTD